MKHWKDLASICFDKEKYQSLEDFWHDVGKQIELLTKYGYAVILENEMSADQPIVTIRTFDTEYDDELYFMSEDDLDLCYQGEQASKQPQAVEQPEAPYPRIETMVACTNCGKSVVGDQAIVDEDGYPYCCEDCLEDFLDNCGDDEDDGEDIIIGTCAYCGANVMDSNYIYACGKYFCDENCLNGHYNEDED